MSNRVLRFLFVLSSQRPAGIKEMRPVILTSQHFSRFLNLKKSEPPHFFLFFFFVLCLQ